MADMKWLTQNSGHSAGVWHMVMLGPPGSGKTMLAKRSGSGVSKTKDRSGQISEIN
jgi:replication-associated recombination protein RarA